MILISTMRTSLKFISLVVLHLMASFGFSEVQIIGDRSVYFNFVYIFLTVISQMSKIIDCSLRRFGDLEFDFRYGACNTFRNEIEYAWLCFDDIGMKSCRT